MDKILLVLTGGTICSFGDEDNNNRDVDISKANRLIIENFRQSGSKYSTQEFDVDAPLNILSENMTIDKWNILIQYLSGKNLDDYKGMIITHGTDTLAYTSSLAALLLSHIGIPVFLVSSNLPLNVQQANGNDNFRVAVECICEKILPGVYVSYRNSDECMYIHKASCLMQCGNYSDDFYSADMIRIGCPETGKHVRVFNEKNFRELELKEIRGGKKVRYYDNISANPLLRENIKLENNVLYIKPYVGLDYSKINLHGIRAVVHNMYHSMTACVGDDNLSQNSILYFIEKCRENGILFIVEPCINDESNYVSGAEILRCEAAGVYGMTSEMVYVKTLLAASLFEKNEDMLAFLHEDICGEFIK